MIGKFCRNFNHLSKNIVKGKSTKIIILRNNTYPEICEVTYNEKSQKVQIYGRVNTNVRSVESCLVTDLDKELFNKYGHVIVPDDSTHFMIWWNSNFYFSSIIILPQDFDEMFEKFKQQNKKAFNQNIEKYSPQLSHLYYAYCLSGDSINFVSWIIKNIYQHKITWSCIKMIMSWNDKYSYLSNKLSKGTITAYSGYDNINLLIKELSSIRMNKRANDSVMQFNTQQKKILKDNMSESKTQTVLSKFGQLSDVKRQNFIRKMSTIDNFDEILKQMSQLCEIHFSWNRDSFLEYLDNTDCIKASIILDRDNFVLIEVQDYETIKRVAKTTNWCISKNKRYWNDYVENKHNTKQYILFDFTKAEDDDMSIVGFTVRKGQGITNAHSFTNNNIMGEGEVSCNLTSFTPISANTIYSILQYHNIPLDLFFKGDTLTFSWNKEEMFKRLYNVVHEDNVTILFNEDNKVVFNVKNYDIYNLFKHDCVQHFDTSVFEYDTMFFFDFNKDENDSNKMLFANIYETDNGEECGGNVYNSLLRRNNIHFDDVLVKFGLPYNTIKRVDNPYKRLLNYISNLNINGINNILDMHPDVIKTLKNNKSKHDNLVYALNDSIFSYSSFDLINCFYQHGIRLYDIMPENRVNEIVFNLIRNAASRYNELQHVPTQDEIERLLNHQIQNRNQCIYIGYYYLVQQVLSIEPFEVFNKTLNGVINVHYKTDMWNAIFIPIINKAIADNINVRNSMNILAQLAYDHGNMEIVEMIKSVKTEHPIMELFQKSKQNSSKPKTFSYATSSRVSVSNFDIADMWDL